MVRYPQVALVTHLKIHQEIKRNDLSTRVGADSAVKNDSQVNTEKYFLVRPSREKSFFIYHHRGRNRSCC